MFAGLGALRGGERDEEEEEGGREKLDKTEEEFRADCLSGV